MNESPRRPTSRRTVLAASLAVPLLAMGGACRADPETLLDPQVIADIEDGAGRRIGLYASNLSTGRTIEHRADDRFALCSTFKVLAAAAVLDGRLIAPGPDALDRPVPYPPSLIAGDIWAPTTKEWFAEGYVPTLRDAAQAAVRDSDNGAVNLLLQNLGGPASVTEFARSIEDGTTRLDRWEPDMSDVPPGEERDTSTPRALGSSYRELVLGTALSRDGRETLTQWMLENTTDPPFRQALPSGWRLADKTGSGSYGARNDVGIAWTDRDEPVLVSCMTRGEDEEDESLDAPLTEVFGACAELLG